MSSYSCESPHFDRLALGEDDVDLAQVLLEIAADATPDLCPAACREELRRLERLVRRRLSLLPRDAPLDDRLRVLGDVLHRQEGFDGNAEDYYDPSNSYLNDVLERRTGIPISLCAVYHLVGRAVGLPLFGVGTPAHFVLGCRDEDEVRFVDAFHSGDVLDFSDCRRRIEQLLGGNDVLQVEHFRPITHREWIVRTLRNLKACYVGQQDWRAALPVQRRLVRLLPTQACECRDLGLICLRAGNAGESVRHLRQFLTTCSGEEREQVVPFLDLASRRVVELN